MGVLASIDPAVIAGRNCFAHPILGLMRARMISIGDGGAIDDIVARVVIVGIVVRVAFRWDKDDLDAALAIVAFRWGEAGAGIDKPGRSRGVGGLIDLVAIQGGTCFAPTSVAFVAFVAGAAACRVRPRGHLLRPYIRRVRRVRRVRRGRGLVDRLLVSQGGGLV
jgi:hypothetical protein